MGTFRTIEELARTLNNERSLLKEMFVKRKTFSFRYEYALSLLDYKEQRLQYLIENGVIRESNNDTLEFEDIYKKFFEEVLQVNDEVNTAFVKDYIVQINENIDYFLKEDKDIRKQVYYQEVVRRLKDIGLATVRSVIDLKRKLDSDYKTEANFKVKKAKLEHLDEKRENIIALIRETEKLIDVDQVTFFSVAMDVRMQDTLSNIRLQFQDASHNLIEIGKQIIEYLNLINYQSQVLEKVRKLKYLRDQHVIEESTDIVMRMGQCNPVWMEPRPSYRIKPSLDTIRSSDDVLAVIRKITEKNKQYAKILGNVAAPIPEDYLQGESQEVQQENIREMFRQFCSSSNHLFSFVLLYEYRREVSMEQRLVHFCQLVSLNADQLVISDQYESYENIEYPLIYAK